MERTICEDKPPEQAHAVQTRSQAAKTDKPEKPLKVPSPISDIVTAEELRPEQKSDPTLRRCFELAHNTDPQTGKDGSVSAYYTSNGIPYRKFSSPNANSNNTFRQVIVPQKLRNQVLKIAHESLLGAHQGIKKTSDRILTSFVWPGIHGDVMRYVRSCDICQRTFPKGRVQKIPLGNMPIIDTPFRRVAVDLVGPIEPRTVRGNRLYSHTCRLRHSLP